MIIPYGFYKDSNGAIQIDSDKSEIVRSIFNLYLNGYSLNRIKEHLSANDILSPTGKSTWTVQSIDNILSNEKYIHIVSSELYVKIQLEKQKRSNMNSDKTRRTVRYNFGNVLSGLLVCGECGKNFRRITRKDGKIAWRCADRVENGKQSTCQNIHAILDTDIKQAICSYLEIDKFDDNVVRNHIYRIEVLDDSVTCIERSEQLFNI